MGKFDYLYKCEFCNKVYVVPGLARSCEEKHLESEDE